MYLLRASVIGLSTFSLPKRGFLVVIASLPPYPASSLPTEAPKLRNRPSLSPFPSLRSLIRRVCFLFSFLTFFLMLCLEDSFRVPLNSPFRPKPSFLNDSGFFLSTCSLLLLGNRVLFSQLALPFPQKGTAPSQHVRCAMRFNPAPFFHLSPGPFPFEITLPFYIAFVLTHGSGPALYVGPNPTAPLTSRLSLHSLPSLHHPRTRKNSYWEVVRAPTFSSQEGCQAAKSILMRLGGLTLFPPRPDAFSRSM